MINKKAANIDSITHIMIFDKDDKCRQFEEWERIDDSYVARIDSVQYLELLESSKVLRGKFTEKEREAISDCGIFKIYDVGANDMKYYVCFDKDKVKFAKKGDV